MKSALLAALLLLSGILFAPNARAQTSVIDQILGPRLDGGSRPSSGADDKREEFFRSLGIAPSSHIQERAELGVIMAKLKRGTLPIPQRLRLVIVESPDVNGSAARRTNTIQINLGSFQLLPEDELAFLVAHEIGHLSDPSPACETVEGHRDHACEDNADWIGEQYMVSAGYSGYAGAGLFGRLMMMGDRASFAQQLKITFFDSHRSEVGRSNNLLASWRAYCQRYDCR